MASPSSETPTRAKYLSGTWNCRRNPDSTSSDDSFGPWRSQRVTRRYGDASITPVPTRSSSNRTVQPPPLPSSPDPTSLPDSDSTAVPSPSVTPISQPLAPSLISPDPIINFKRELPEDLKESDVDCYIIWFQEQVFEFQKAWNTRVRREPWPKQSAITDTCASIVFINALSCTIGLIEKRQEQGSAVKSDVQHKQIQGLQNFFASEHTRVTGNDPTHVAALQRDSLVNAAIKSSIKTLRRKLRTVEDSIVDDMSPADNIIDAKSAHAKPADDNPVDMGLADRRLIGGSSGDDQSPIDMQVSSELHTPAEESMYGRAYRALILLLVFLATLIGLDYLTGSTILHSVLRVRPA